MISLVGGSLKIINSKESGGSQEVECRRKYGNIYQKV